MTAFSFSAHAQPAGQDEPESDFRVSGPHVHDNLALYFIHGKSAPGTTPLTLDEALKLERVRVLETGNVNELQIENTGDEPIFIQSGDIVKGGKQDRVITSSFVLKPKSGAVPLAAFCVEHGRWSSRGTESAAVFASSAEAMPSRAAKMYFREAEKSRSTEGYRGEVSKQQAAVWSEVEKAQKNLTAGVKSSVSAAQSPSSLQLSMENDNVRKAREAYMASLEKAGVKDDDVIGYAFAVNGKLNSADVYSSNGLFRKMWPKQLKSVATEALGEKEAKPAAGAAPSLDDVKAFLANARASAATETSERNDNKLQIRESDKSVYMAASPTKAGIVHENFLAK